MQYYNIIAKFAKYSTKNPGERLEIIRLFNVEERKYAELERNTVFKGDVSTANLVALI
jgi:hypothetical protein